MADPSPNKLKSKLKLKGAGRKRRLTGWTLIALGLLVTGVWGASGWNSIRLGEFGSQSERTVGIDRGYAAIWPTYIDPGTMWRGRFDSPTWRWWGFEHESDFSYSRTYGVPLWPIPLLLWAAGVPVLRSGILARRRANTGACSKCGYSLAGLGEGAGCPECEKPE